VPTKRLFYFTSQRVTAYLWGKNELRKEAAFDANQDGAAELSKYVARSPESLFYVLADIVEEDFFQENIPYVRGRDRRALLSRKLAQRYRDTTLAVPISLGSEVHAGRREERILYTSFTNTQQFQPLLEALRAAGARVAGVFSVALAAGAVGKRLGFKASRYLVVSLQQAGLRQSYVENGRVRFSRLSRVDFSDPRAIAQDCAAESLRIHQYLANARILPREADPLDVLVLAPTEYKALYDAVCVNSARLRFHVRDLDAMGRSLGLKSAPTETLAEGLFLYVLAESAPRDQYADDGLRRFYHLWRARVGLIGAGAAAFAACVLFSAVNLLDLYEAKEQTRMNREQEAQAAQEYARLQKNFPKTPTSADHLKAIVTNYRAILRQSTSPSGMFVEISEAVTAMPQIEIDKIDWEVGGEARFQQARSGSKAPAAPASKASKAGQDEPPTQTVEISGKLITTQASDYRAVTALINQFADALRRKPGTEVVRTQLPFDINAEKSISGDIGAARREEVPQFSVVLNKRQGT
jgi:hypothetical protein